ncbi:hypothetical protein ACTXT7_003188 [Hymenolepis weldensis]
MSSVEIEYFKNTYQQIICNNLKYEIGLASAEHSSAQYFRAFKNGVIETNWTKLYTGSNLSNLKGEAYEISRYIIDATESYTVAFTIGGVGIFLAGLVMCPAIIRQIQHQQAKKRRLEARKQAATANCVAATGDDILVCSSPQNMNPSTAL